MKKLSVLLTLTGFSLTAAAQQNGFFDIQKYLQKKSQTNKLFTKPLLSQPPFQNNLFTPGVNKLNNQKDPSYILPNGDKVYILPQDNMPCITPGMSQLQNRNSWYLIRPVLPLNNTPGNIPNAFTPKTGK